MKNDEIRKIQLISIYKAKKGGNCTKKQRKTKKK